MAENVGAIKYTVSADTADMLKAEAVIDKSLGNISKDFDKADAAVKQFEKSQKSLGNTVNKMGQVINKNGDIVEDLTLDYRKLAAEASGTFDKLSTQISKSAKGVNAGLSSVGRSAGQAGIQFQQFIGQVQGGQDVMLALSAQSADLGFVLGAPLLGAIVGISASIAGMLVPSLFKTTEGIIDLDESINKLTDNFDRLSESQQAVARTALVERIKEQKKAAKELAAEVNKIQSELIVAERQDGFLESLIGSDPEKLRAELAKVKGSLTVQNLAIKDSKKELSELGSESEKLTKSIDDISNGLTGQIVALTSGAEASLRFATAQQLNLKAGEQIPANIDAQITALFQLKKAQEDAAKSESDAAKLKAEKSKASGFAKGIVKRGLSPEQKLEADMQKLLRDEELVSITEFEAAKTSIEQQQSDLRKKIREDEAKAAASTQMAMTGAVLGFISASTSALLAGMDEQSGAYKALFAIQKASQVAMTIANAETAATSAMAATPGVGGIALANVVRGLGYASAGIIAGTAISGARQFGGPVNAGSAYRVGEAGPEIYTSGGKNFMIPGENGKVIANDDIGGMGGFTQNVEIINNTPANVSTKSSSDGKQLKIFIGEVARQINENQGEIPRALRNGSNYQSKANR